MPTYIYTYQFETKKTNQTIKKMKLHYVSLHLMEIYIKNGYLPF